MSKIMLINVTHAEESRVGIVENGQLESFEIESLSREHLKGNIYKGIVRRIHPAIEAAFVDIGAEREAFLPLDEICFRNLPPGRNGATDEKGRRRIKDILKSGDEVLVQIVKEQFTSKPPTLSTFYSLPGRYLVLLPGSEDAGISRKIEGEERVRIREMIARLEPPPGCGIIVRTAASFDEEQAELERDLNYLQRLWESIRSSSQSKRAPTLVYREHDLVLRNIRDYFTPDIDEIFIDNEEVCARARDFLHNVMPAKEHVLHLYEGEQPIFSRFKVESQIESIYKRRVQLKSGGSIVIDGTEALTAIDVNSGGSMRGTNQEETAHKTNCEAAVEIARQLRLRDLGGIIVVDFIDMRQQGHVSAVENALRDAMRPDKARHDIGHISRLGLLEISRQRLRPAAAASSYTACPMCEGHGAVRTTESAALVALRKIHNRIAEGDVAQMKVSLPRDVAMYLLNQKRDDLAVLEARYAASIHLALSEKLMAHQSEIEVRIREIAERPLVAARAADLKPVERAARSEGVARRAAGTTRPVRGRAAASVETAQARPMDEAGGEGSAVRAESNGARPRRRRRRGGRGRNAGAVVVGAEPVLLDVPAEPSAAGPDLPEAATEASVEHAANGVSFAEAAGVEETPGEVPQQVAPEGAAGGEAKHEPVFSPVPERAAGGEWKERALGEDLQAAGPDTPGPQAGELDASPHRAQAGRSEEDRHDVMATEVGEVTGKRPTSADVQETAGDEATDAQESAGDGAADAPSETQTAAPSPAPPRRRRRGKRGGRGRKAASAEASAPPATAPGGPVTGAASSSEENHSELPEPAGTVARPAAKAEDTSHARRSRRRRSGARRRRSKARPNETAGVAAEPPAGT